MLKQFKHRMCIALKRFQNQLMEPYISLYLITGKGGGGSRLKCFLSFGYTGMYTQWVFSLHLLLLKKKKTEFLQGYTMYDFID